jgi:single-strand DNA-binding protein
LPILQKSSEQRSILAYFLYTITIKKTMALEVKGKLLVIMAAQQVTEKFRKREFVLEIANGSSQYVEQVKFQLAQDKCSLLDSYREGDEVNVHFNLRGKPYTKNGETIYFNNLDVWRIEGLSGKTAHASVPDYDGFAAPPPTDENLPF